MKGHSQHASTSVFLAIFLSVLPVLSAASAVGSGLPVAPEVIGEKYIVDSIGDDNTPDDGKTTLREAIAAANANPGMDTIVFSSALANQRIQVPTGYLINDDLQINAAEAPGLTIESTNTNLSHLFNLSGSSRIILSDINLSGSRRSAARMIYACGEIELNRIKATNFHMVINPCDEVSISVNSSTLSDNTYLSWMDFAGSGVSRDFELHLTNSLIHDSRASLRNTLGTAQIHAIGSIFSGNSTISLNGAGAELHVGQSSFIDNTEGSAVSSQGGASISVVNSTFSGFTREILWLNHTDTRIAHSTIYNNIMSRSSGFSPSLIYTNGGSIEIDHSLITGNEFSLYGIDVRYADLTAKFSIIPEINVISSTIELDQTSQQYNGANVALSSRSTDLSVPPYYMPLSGSFIISAGEQGAASGVGDIPEVEQRGSSRVVGDGIEIGAVEFNAPPVLDITALREELNAQFSVLSQAGNPDGDIVLDLNNFVSDPDGHAINDISLAGDELLTFDTISHILSGSRDNLLASRDLVVFMEDETGLIGVADVRLSGNSSGGGSLPFLMLLLAGLLLPLRRR